MYLTGCADGREGQSVQSFVVEVEGVEVTSVCSSELRRGLMDGTELEAAIGENVVRDPSISSAKKGTCLNDLG